MASMDALKQMLAGNKQSGGGDRKEFYKFPKSTDEVKIRLLPPWPGSEAPFKPQMQHFGLPGDDTKPLPCLKLIGKECPICEVCDKYRDRTKDVNKYESRLSGGCNILVRKDPTQKISAIEPLPARFSQAQMEWVLKIMDEEGGANFIDAYEGRDIVINRKKYNGAFEMRPAFSATSIGDDEEQIQSILSKLTDFDKHAFYQLPNDDDCNQVLKAAKALDDYIENKVLSQGGDNGGTPDRKEGDSEPSMEGAPAGKTVQRPPTGSSTVTPPAKSTPPPTTKPAAGTTAKPQSQAKAPATSAPATKTVVKPGGATKTTVAPAAKASGTRLPNAPSDAPDCFGHVDQYVENSEKCTKCEHEFQCQGIVAASK